MTTTPAAEHDPTEGPEVDAIIGALARIRGRRGPHRGDGPGGGFPLPGHPHEPHPGGPQDADGAEGPPWRDPRGRHPGGGRGGFGGPALLRLLSTLAHASTPLTVSEIAGEIGVDQPRASRLVQQAVERGFAAREADPEDARRTRVRISQAGERAVHGFRGRQRAEAGAALAALEPTERAELARLLTKLAAAWPQHDPQP
ncbi:MarR family winged helix-turn-helix transcriptional regulator [Leucobacter chromiireducens]|uniref:MarR family winged helix-turn-helix transcriptional regulator n=1 Tax=Leucobacter chromiireducens TaxID=283877 RepID=UPI001F14C7A2|nr:MarR family winged helix-turn-helix transcriptional regulator [Leucobacter chromiireducens]